VSGVHVKSCVATVVLSTTTPPLWRAITVISVGASASARKNADGDSARARSERCACGSSKAIVYVGWQSADATWSPGPDGAGSSSTTPAGGPAQVGSAPSSEMLSAGP
jgi:hypothetical protein